MANLTGFDANTVEPNKPFEAIPPDWYKTIINASELKPTKAGDGNFLELELTIIEGQHEGRKLWDRLNLDNKNEQAVQIAKGTLSAICRAVGKLTPKDSAELHNIPLMAKVVIKEYEGEKRNDVKGYKPCDGVGGGAAGVPKLSQASTPAPGASTQSQKPKAPWAK